MRRLAEGRDSESDGDDDDQEHNEPADHDHATRDEEREEKDEDQDAADKRYERLQRMQEQAIEESLKVERLPQSAAGSVTSSPLPAAAQALPPGRWDDLPRIPAAPWQPMSVSGTAALGDVMTTLITSFNAAGVCVGLAEWVGHAVVAVGAAPVLGRGELCWQLAQLPLMKASRSAAAAVQGAATAGGVELTLAPVEDALAVYGAMCESREQQARGLELEGLLQVVREQHEQLATLGDDTGRDSTHHSASSSTEV